MIAFAALLAALEADPQDAPALLAAYLADAPDADRLWSIALLTGRRPRRGATPAELRAWAGAAAGLPDWLLDESLAAVGDLAETAALILPDPEAGATAPTLDEAMAILSALPGQPAEARRAAAMAAWARLPAPARFPFNRLLSGTFRATLPGPVIGAALAPIAGLTQPAVALALAGPWHPRGTSLSALFAPRNTSAAPLPLAPLSALAVPADRLGAAADWQALPYGTDPRAQIVAGEGTAEIWSETGELLTPRFPELAPLLASLPPGCVLDGRIVDPDRSPAAKAPRRFEVFDLLCADHADLRQQALAARQAALLDLAGRAPLLRPAAPLALPDWSALTGPTLLRRLAGPYPQGAATGDWLLWKPPARTVRAVLLYAELAPGRPPTILGLTLALRRDDGFLPVAKPPPDLPAADLAELAARIPDLTRDRFGPVRQLAPALVFELAFDGVVPSRRHKAGLVLRAPRVLRWLREATAADVDALDLLLPPAD